MKLFSPITFVRWDCIAHDCYITDSDYSFNFVGNKKQTNKQTKNTDSHICKNAEYQIW